MNDILKQLGDNLFNMAKNAIKLRSVNKDDLHNTIKENIARHQKMVQIMNTFNKQELAKIEGIYNNVMNNSKGLISANIYQDFYKALTPKGKSEESKSFLNSLKEVNDNFKDILIGIDKKLDTLLTERSISLSNVRITGIAIIGIIKQSDILLNWTSFLWNQVMTANTTGDIAGLRKYRSDYLNTNLSQVVTTVNNVLNKQGAYSFLAEAEQLKKRNADFVLNASTASINFSSLANNIFSKGFIDNLETVLSVLNIFRWAREKYEDWQHETYLADKAMLSWMEMQASLLQDELRELDHDSPAYQTKLKIIEGYDNNIADYHRKIAEYENQG